MKNQGDLTRKLVEVVSRLIDDEGFALPIYCANVSSTGQLIFGRFDCEPGSRTTYKSLAEHLTDSRLFRLPWNTMFTDTSGKGSLVTFDVDGETLN